MIGLSLPCSLFLSLKSVFVDLSIFLLLLFFFLIHVGSSELATNHGGINGRGTATYLLSKHLLCIVIEKIFCLKETSL